MSTKRIQLGSLVVIDDKAIRSLSKLVKECTDLTKAMAEVVGALARLELEINRGKDHDLALMKLRLEATRQEAALLKSRRTADIQRVLNLHGFGNPFGGNNPSFEDLTPGDFPDSNL